VLIYVSGTDENMQFKFGRERERACQSLTDLLIRRIYDATQNELCHTV